MPPGGEDFILRFCLASGLKKGGRRLLWASLCASLALPLLPQGLQPADANGDTRALHIRNTHNGETIDLTFKRDGRYDQEALKKYNRFLRDWRTNDETHIDPRLLDLVWEVYRDIGGQEPINLVSSYRSPQTNNFLRTRSAHTGVAKHSQHTLGKAMDFFVPGVPLARIRERGMLRQRGGVGFYPTSGSPFVHLDVGNVRAWPRMTRQQLVRLFPNGHTLHLPADGPPLPGYEDTVAQLGRDGKRGDAVLAYAHNEDRPQAGSGRPASNVLASLFGGGRDEDEEDAPAKKTINPRVEAVAARAVSPPARLPVAVRETAAEKKPDERKAVADEPKQVAALPAAAPAPAPLAALAPKPLPRPIVTAALEVPKEEAPAAAPVPGPVPQPLPRPTLVESDAFSKAVSGHLPPLPPARAASVIASFAAHPAPVAPIAREGLDSTGAAATLLAPLAARLREEVAKAELAKLDYRHLDARTLAPTPMTDGAELTPPSVGNVQSTLGPALLATHFGRRQISTVAAFAGPALRARRPNTI